MKLKTLLPQQGITIQHKDSQIGWVATDLTPRRNQNETLTGEAASILIVTC